MKYTEDESRAAAAIHEAIAAEVALAPPGPGWVLSEWVAVTSWTNINTGKSYMTRVAATHMLVHHVTGMLHEALKPDWGDKDDMEPYA